MREKTKTRRVTTSVVADLIIGELLCWRVGICRIYHSEGNVVVRGENDFRIASIDVDENSISEIVEKVNDAIQEEYNKL